MMAYGILELKRLTEYDFLAGLNLKFDVVCGRILGIDLFLP